MKQPFPRPSLLWSDGRFLCVTLDFFKKHCIVCAVISGGVTMSQENLVLVQFACIFILWAGFRYAINKAPLGISGWLSCILVGVYAGHGIMLYILLSKDVSVLSRIKWDSLQTIQSIVGVFAIAFVIYAGIMLIARVVILHFELLKKILQR